MRALFCYGAPDANGNESKPLEGLSADDRRSFIDQQEALEDAWDASYSPEAVRKTLEQWLLLMETLEKWLPRTKAEHVAEHNFVCALYQFWTMEIGLKAENSRAGGKQSGDFAEYVPAAATIIPAETPGRPKNWDYAIRRPLEGERWAQ